MDKLKTYDIKVAYRIDSVTYFGAQITSPCQSVEDFNNKNYNKQQMIDVAFMAIHSDMESRHLEGDPELTDIKLVESKY